ncbi:MAG TPA: hypothetical protein DIW47_01145 [Bacteroidetes bacterium]|nr:hypothetical protein [Bacteroidota bacterium]
MKGNSHLDQFGTAGLFLTALFSPCCFPLFAFAASAAGLGSFELFGGWTMWVFEGMVLLALGGLYLSYRRHRCLYPLLVAIPGGLLIFYGYHITTSEHWAYFLYTGMFGLLAATIWNYRRNKLHGHCATCEPDSAKSPELESTITCPNCGHTKTETMPSDACVYFYECENCKAQLKPLKGDCCVFCSYGTVKCPPMQDGKGCC